MNRTRNVELLTIFCSLALSGSTLATGATQIDATPTATAAAVEEGPVMDGVVDDEVWKRAEVITGFIQAEPYEGEPATERTEGLF